MTRHTKIKLGHISIGLIVLVVIGLFTTGPTWVYALVGGLFGGGIGVMPGKEKE